MTRPHDAHAREGQFVQPTREQHIAKVQEWARHYNDLGKEHSARADEARRDGHPDHAAQRDADSYRAFTISKALDRMAEDLVDNPGQAV